MTIQPGTLISLPDGRNGLMLFELGERSGKDRNGFPWISAYDPNSDLEHIPIFLEEIRSYYGPDSFSRFSVWKGYSFNKVSQNLTLGSGRVEPLNG